MSNTIDQQEIENFSAMSGRWWDEEGPFKPLHRLNPTRLEYIRMTLDQHFTLSKEGLPLKNIKILDIGCGGGLVTEPMARLGACVTGIDASEKTIEIARHHAQLMELEIDYHCQAVEDLTNQAGSFNVVLALEIIEHVDQVPVFLEKCLKLLNANGILILSTINRTWQSYLMAIVGAEYILRWLPRGTHQWHKFITPAELANHLRPLNCRLLDIKGLSYKPLSQEWSLTNSLDVNYFVTVSPVN